jgi:hypothetical protein
MLTPAVELRFPREETASAVPTRQLRQCVGKRRCRQVTFPPFNASLQSSGVLAPHRSMIIVGYVSRLPVFQLKSRAIGRPTLRLLTDWQIPVSLPTLLSRSA